ncbi:2,3-dihydroxyphenylpropionate 1,2-dioxygenase [Sphingobium sp. Cam5-1]|uniref:DODA-type extradiol aromatic ring-opening family dioxygenase n=1 Tax=Sphingobium sp. Cam5-1 TaxID=2789327 RepID=UPI0018AD14E3|nr:2,3-dihydroxyphenylpropionate 1,2-dioxygenase [Sphingobium sp. Cam5-1]QPI75032.1 2,3-dihydroxyphenylpropionate 1,2-dioxygenase [Sphingobium sp. Cam5-1]
MADIVAFAAMSHAPFWNGERKISGPGAIFTEGVERARTMIEQSGADTLVIFGPDHYRNFFLDVMPSFCIGVDEVIGIGDYGTSEGPLLSAAPFGRVIVDGTRGQGFDPAVSVRMGIDHGIAQPHDVLVSGLPIVPIMVNCGSAPRPSFRRCYEFGQAVGRAIAASSSANRVCIIGSGGLSHWVKPMAVDDPALDDTTRQYLISGRALAADYSRKRDRSLAKRIADGVDGNINVEWDDWVLSRIAAGDIDAVLDMDSDQVEAAAGNGAHEVRAWLAALGAWSRPVERLAYEPIRSWVTGMGIIGGHQ